MGATSLQERGLAPLEQRDLGQGHYTDFWTTTYPTALQDVLSLTPKDYRLLDETAGFVSSVTHELIRSDGIAPGNCLPGGALKAMKQIGLWSRVAGSLNSMEDGTDDMLRAADYLLRVNEMKRRGTQPWRGLCGVTEGSADFITNWKGNDIALQLPSRTLMQGAELVHKAAWTSSDETRRRRLLGIAGEMYRHYSGAASVPSRNKRLAYNYTSDIAFHAQMEKAKWAQQAGNTSGEDRMFEKMDAALRSAAAILSKKFGNLLLAGEGSMYKGGLLFEDFVVLALRRTIINSRMTDFEVRHAFTHEDNSLPRLMPKAAFDIVVQRHHEAGITATPVQLKFYSPEHEKWRTASKPEKYLPGIVYLSVNDLKLGSIQNALAKVAGIRQVVDVTSDNLSAFKRLEDELGPMLLAA